MLSLSSEVPHMFGTTTVEEARQIWLGLSERAFSSCGAEIEPATVKWIGGMDEKLETTAACVGPSLGGTRCNIKTCV